MRIILLLILLLVCKLFYAQRDSLQRADSLTMKSDSLVSIVTQPLILVPDSACEDCCKTYCESGIASYYGRQFHGRTTSSGERFDMYKYTAAHKTLPLGTYVVVTNLANCKSVVVKINDRMPPWNRREIDLAQGAAQYLGYCRAGLTNVQIEIYKPKIPLR
jgi:rare lipoprotein A